MLTEPLTLPCGAVIQNRLAKAAMTERLAGADHNPNEHHYHLYALWSESRPGLMITGNIMVDRLNLESAGNIVVEDRRAMIQLKNWSEVAKKYGSHFWGQINCAGRQTTRFVNGKPIAPSPIRLKGKLGFFAKPKQMSKDDILEYIDRYGNTAEILKESGFTGVQIHAAHGYLISQFLSPRTNKRKDEFGGDIAGRAKFLYEVYKSIRSKVGDNFPVAVKINSSDYTKGGFSEEDCISVIRELSSMGVDLIEVSGGTYDNLAFLSGTQPSKDNNGPYFAEFAKLLEDNFPTPIMLTGGIHDNTSAKAILEQKYADMVGLARPFLIESDLGKKFMDEETFSVSSPPLPQASGPFAWMLEGGFYSKYLINLATRKKPPFNLTAGGAIRHILFHEFFKSVAHRILG